MSIFVMVPVLVLVASVFVAMKAIKGGAKFRKALALQLCSFMAVCVLCLAVPMVAHAAPEDEAQTKAVTSTSQEATSNDNSKGIGLIAAALCTGIAAIGGGMAVGSASSAAIGATSEDSKNFGKALIFVALGEGIAIYGLLVSILILSRI